MERDKKNMKKWIFTLTPLRILLRLSAAGAKHLLCSSVPKAQGISPEKFSGAGCRGSGENRKYISICIYTNVVL